MAEAVSGEQAALPAPEATEETAPATEPRVSRRQRRAERRALVAAAEPPHAARFQFLFGALFALGAVAMAVTILLISDGPRDQISGPAWSVWSPTTNKVSGGAQEIATHVGREYRQPTGEQLVAVTGGKLEIDGLPMTIAVRQPASAGGEISLLNGRGVLYRLCGLGSKCSIAKGKPSTARHLLLRREALELALYSFRYLRGVDDVVVFLPPAKGKDPSQAIHITSGEIKPELQRPLTFSLPSPAPTPTTVDRSPDASFVDRITTQNLFQFSLTQGNRDANVFLVLDPLKVAPLSKKKP